MSRTINEPLPRPVVASPAPAARHLLTRLGDFLKHRPLRPDTCPGCQSSDVHRYTRQSSSEYFFLTRPYRCFTCNLRFTWIHVYATRLNRLVHDKPNHPISKVARRVLQAANRGDSTRW